ncbi:hypothetical protein EHP00_17 [Ecytonucleospora hepatopenaei]|uniref:Uncharacterized protein n=1 Tax=Ecytonucleospora hepatopenaei TaxID=646526 RepID=A0A1W0E5P9_9MICR|nr:hypothetical protein EHP00_17 [Ecytonucleospora hepatopenaei]
MFRALNTELDDFLNKIELEKTKIEQFYNDSLEKKKYFAYFDFKIQYDENMFFYTTGKNNLMFNYVKDTSIENLEDKIEEYDFRKYKSAYFCFLRKLMKNSEIKKTKKYLQVAYKNKWYTYDFFEISDRLKLLEYNVSNEINQQCFVYKKPF